MALVKNTAVKTETVEGQFEDVSETTTAAEPIQQQVETKTEAAAEEAAPTQDKAVEKAVASKAVALQHPVVMLAKLSNAKPPAEFGTMPRIAPTSAGFKDGDGKYLGGKVTLTITSFNDLYTVTPRDDSKDALKVLRFSTDPVQMTDTREDPEGYAEFLIDGGLERTVQSYLAFVKLDWPKAEVANYLEVQGFLEKTEKPSEHVDKTVVVSLSPESRKLFKGYCQLVSDQLEAGRITGEGVNIIDLEIVMRSGNNRTYAVVQPSQHKA